MTSPMRVWDGRSVQLGLRDRIALAARVLTRREFQGQVPEGVIPPRGPARRGSAYVTAANSMRHSAVWAALRLRANLISTFPLDVYRHGTGDLAGIDIEVPRPPVLIEPGGSQWDYVDWTWASQHQFDSAGNVVGIITEWDGNGLPGRIDLQPLAAVTVIQRKGQREPIYKIDGVEYKGGAWTKPGDPGKIWHERAYPVPGMAIGLSPIAYAAYSIGEYMSIQDFVLDWFGGGAIPKAYMRNKARTLKTDEITKAKTWYHDAVSNGDVMVFGNDWEYSMIQAANAGLDWLSARGATSIDVARFLDVPADLLDAAMSGQSVTYASIGQRNMQLLIMHIGPTVIKREKNLSKLTSRPRFVRMNTNALLRMDPETQARIINTKILNKTMTNDEARALDNLPPLTPEEIARAAELYPMKVTPATAAPAEPPPDANSPQALADWWTRYPHAPTSPAPMGEQRW